MRPGLCNKKESLALVEDNFVGWGEGGGAFVTVVPWTWLAISEKPNIVRGEQTSTPPPSNPSTRQDKTREEKRMLDVVIVVVAPRDAQRGFAEIGNVPKLDQVSPAWN